MAEPFIDGGCLAVERVYVFGEVYDEIVEGFTRRVALYEPGDGVPFAERFDGDVVRYRAA